MKKLVSLLGCVLIVHAMEAQMNKTVINAAVVRPVERVAPIKFLSDKEKLARIKTMDPKVTATTFTDPIIITPFTTTNSQVALYYTHADVINPFKAGIGPGGSMWIRFNGPLTEGNYAFELNVQAQHLQYVNFGSGQNVPTPPANNGVILMLIHFPAMYANTSYQLMLTETDPKASWTFKGCKITKVN